MVQLLALKTIEIAICRNSSNNEIYNMFSEISNPKILNLEHGRKHCCFGSNNDTNGNLSTNKYTKELDTRAPINFINLSKINEILLD